ncbi:class I SAM-dependent methyltransferase [Sulfuricurvum sp.]|uniref:class I SAM-dependent DNA methyltransferase n=1 Tax=Sulfuricurvum sp. TaxID=2025608 RepID=UPI001983FABE|nr:class I SAM-dependent methyltransferase [Sulfuricurvum sp.]MBD3798637.1 class I SAM-dependent methyltransferase [Campylobacterota bacterium]MBD3806365.1 class I SAM-dependent methyltransferase [Sulfuricurvum sp.]
MSERFNQVAGEWDKGGIRQNIAHFVFQTIASRIALLNNMNIMDFGAGTGLLSFKIASMVKRVVGVDLSQKMLEQLESKNNSTLSVQPICQDILNTPLQEQFHGIVSSMAMHHVEDTFELFKAFYNHLKRDGFIAIADLEAEDGTFHTHGNDGVYHFGFEKESLRGTIEKAGFEHVRFHHAYTVQKSEREYPIFVVTATKKVVKSDLLERF